MGSRNQCWSHNATMAWTSIKPALLQLESLLLASSSSENFSTTATSSFPWEGRSASAECPPQTGFNAFAFLAFILLAIDTIMNINNNINNNQNNNNNNDRNNNNNNMFENMQMNMNSGRMLTGLSSVRAEALLKGGNVSPWDKQIFKELHQEMQETGGHSKVDVMRAWLVSVMVSSPSCLTI